MISMPFDLANGSMNTVFSSSLSAPPQEQNVIERPCTRAGAMRAVSPGAASKPVAATDRSCRLLIIVRLLQRCCCIRQYGNESVVPADLDDVADRRRPVVLPAPKLDGAALGRLRNDL